MFVLAARSGAHARRIRVAFSKGRSPLHGSPAARSGRFPGVRKDHRTDAGVVHHWNEISVMRYQSVAPCWRRGVGICRREMEHEGSGMAAFEKEAEPRRVLEDADRKVKTGRRLWGVLKPHWRARLTFRKPGGRLERAWDSPRASRSSRNTALFNKACLAKEGRLRREEQRGLVGHGTEKTFRTVSFRYNCPV